MLFLSERGGVCKCTPCLRAWSLPEKETVSRLRGNRYGNNKRVEFKPGGIVIAPRGNKRPVNGERVELKPHEKELVSS